MEYKEHEVLDIIRLCTDKDPQTILDKWKKNKSNTKINLQTWNYPYFVYTFPLIIKKREVASITLVSLYGGNLNNEKPDLMQKYFGADTYEKSWWAFSHDSYLDCYLTIHEEFELPKISKGFYGGEYKALDANGKEFEFSICTGYPKKEDDEYLFYKYGGGIRNETTSYRFDNGVNIVIPNDIEGWTLGEKINENISKRIRTDKIDEVSSLS